MKVLLDTCALSELRRAHPVFRRRRFFSGRQQGPDGSAQRDIIWLTPAGTEMTLDDWDSGFARSLGVFLNGHAITEPGPRGEAITDCDFLLLFNADSEPVAFTLPSAELGGAWQVVVDTASAETPPPSSGRNGAGQQPQSGRPVQQPGSALPVAARALVVLQAVNVP